MAAMKYIRDNFGTIVVFSNNLLHKNVAEALNLNPVSAGSISLVDGEIKTNGESVSLGVCSKQVDTEKITKQLDFFDGV